MGRLDEIDLSVRLRRADYEKRLKAAQRRFLALRLHLGGQTNEGKLGPGLLVVVEGSDAGGKGGADEKIEAMRLAGISVADSPATIGQTMLEAMAA